MIDVRERGERERDLSWEFSREEGTFVLDSRVCRKSGTIKGDA